MPKVDVTQVLNALDGEPLVARTTDVDLCPECRAKLEAARELLTLRMACTRSLTLITDSTRNMSGDEKFRRGQLAQRIYNEDEPNLIAEEIVTLKEAIGKVEGVTVVLRAFEILDPQE
jgi:hypothetical protein